jgi:UTP--glucose-1-phosphate uridylyltransferase
MTGYPLQFEPFARLMKAEGLPDIFIRNFAYYYDRLLAGEDGMIAENEIQPVRALDNSDCLPDHLVRLGLDTAGRTVIIKLNGGLGTSMGLTAAKSLLMVKDGLNFLDMIARQAIQAGSPLVLMNSFATNEESLASLAGYKDLPGELPLSFLQHKQPKIFVNDSSPAYWPEDKDLEWCPPGHGDLYTALETSGLLGQMLDQGYEYGFVSNADNLGAVLDPGILGYMIEKQLPFLIEVADRTGADRKGGHLAQRLDGQLVLREIAQCPADDLDTFQDIERHKFFNTNNLWLHLPTIRKVLRERNYLLGLPMIRNRKTIDPRDPDSNPVYQLETAMGSAIAVFKGAEAIRVPRSRFAPVKKTDDLLAIRSDAYALTADYHFILVPEREGVPPVVELDPNYYRFVGTLDQHFPAGPPSMKHCVRLRVDGEFEFGSGISLVGDVHFRNSTLQCIPVPAGLKLENGIWPVLSPNGNK